MADPFNATALIGAPMTWFTAPLLFGCMMNWFLFGALTVQVYDYSMQFQSRDRLWVRCLVYGIYTAEMIGSILVTETVWEGLLGSWGEVMQLPACPKSAPANILNNIISLVVQVFFAWRMFCLRPSSPTKVGASFVVAMAVFSLVTAALFVKQFMGMKKGESLDTLTTTMNLHLVSVCICDTTIAFIMVTLLLRARKATGHPQTKTVLNRLIVHAIEAGVATAVVAAIQLGLFIKSPNSHLEVAMFYMLSGLYSNSLVASVNGRHRMRSILNVDVDHPCVTSFHISPMTDTVPGNSGTEESSLSSVDREDSL